MRQRDGSGAVLSGTLWRRNCGFEMLGLVARLRHVAETRSDLRDMLHYVQTGKADGALSRDIDSLVLTYNQDREWVNRVLTYEQDTEIRCQRAKAEGIEQGIEQGEARLLALAQRLSAAGRLDDLLRAADDSAYRDALFEEFEL